MLDNFDSLQLERQLCVSEFLSVRVSELKLVDCSTPPQISISGLAKVFGEIGGESDIDIAEAEWHDVASEEKKPTGCCIIS